MMRPLRDLSIRQKLTRVAMLASSLALVFAAAAFIVYDILAFRSAVVQRLSTEAEIVASNSASPVHHSWRMAKSSNRSPSSVCRSAPRRLLTGIRAHHTAHQYGPS